MRIPKGRCFPSAFGRYRRFTGEGRYRPARSAASISARNSPTPRGSIAGIVSASIPAAPPWLRTLSMLPTGRHSYRSGRTAQGTAVSYSAWHTPIAGVGVVVLFQGGCWPSPACPRPYLLTSLIQARPLPSSVFRARLPRYYEPLGLPPGLRDFSLPALYARSWPDWAARQGLSCSALFCPNLPPPATPERSSIRSGLGCCLWRNETSGSFLLLLNATVNYQHLD